MSVKRESMGGARGTLKEGNHGLGVVGYGKCGWESRRGKVGVERGREKG